MIIKQYIDKLKRFLEKLLPEETICGSKKKWNKLARENSRYVIASRKGKGITEDEFKILGAENYNDLILNDPILLEKLKPYSDRNVLEIGCDIGRLSEFFANDFKNITGIDISEEMVGQGKKRLAHIKNLNFIATDGVNYPFPLDHFDLVFSYLVFQHMPSKEVIKRNFKEIFRVLRSDGIAKIQIRGGHQPYKWQWFYGPSFNLEEATKMVTEIGFKIIKTEGEKEKRFWLWLKK